MQPTNANTRKVKISDLYGEAGLIYIRYHATIETKPNGQKKIKGKHPKFLQIEEQPTYGKGSGDYYSLLMGREIKLGRFVILLDFDNKEDEGSRTGLELAEMLDMDQYGAPKQKTPSGGLHYLFTVSGEQANHINSRTGITVNWELYNADVRFKNSLCNCAPTKIEGYGEYRWVNISKLSNIPKLPTELYEVIRNRREPPAPSVAPTRTPTTEPTSTIETPTPTREQSDDMRALCSCLSIAQLDDYKFWIDLGLRMKKLGFPMSLWEEVSQRSTKNKPGECARLWDKMVPNGRWTLGGMVPLAKEGNMEMFERILPRLHLAVSQAETDEDFRPTVIDTPFLLAREQEEPNDGQKVFKELTESFMGQQERKALIVRSRYGSGKTYFLQQLMKRQDMKRVLFITYRQTLARDIMRNFGRLGFKNYLDVPDHPEVWNAPKLIVQLDSLLNVYRKNDRVLCEGRFEKSYDMIILDESESLLNHFDERTMSNKEIQTWNFFDELLKHSRKVVLMDGDVSRRSLSFAKTYGEPTYIKNTNADGQKTLNLMLDEGMWRTQLHGDLERYFGEDPGFRVCVVSQSSSMAVGLEQEIKEKHPYLKVQRLVGTDSGETKRQFMENINETLQDANVFIYSPVIESGVDITLPVKKLYGALCSRSNSQRAYLQMLARCRRVEESRIDILNDSSLRVNNNYNFWRYDEVLELNKHSVEHTSPEFQSEGEYLTLVEDNDRNRRRKMISVYNTVEKLNKNPCLFINHLRRLSEGKGMGFQITEKPSNDGEAGPKTKQKDYKLAAIMEAPDIDHDEYEDLSAKKKHGKTTVEENYKCERHYWQSYLGTKELDEDVVKAHMYKQGLLWNFLSLIDMRNYIKQDNLSSAKHVERVGLMQKLLEGLGFASPMDAREKDLEGLLTGFRTKICEDPLFQNKKRINSSGS